MNSNLQHLKHYCSALITLFLGYACMAQSPSTVLDNLWNIDGNPNSSSSRIPFGRDINREMLWFAQGFKTGSNAQGYVLNSATLAFDNAIGQPTSFTLEIYNTSTGGVPNTMLGRLTGSSDPDTRGSYIYSAQNVLLAPGANYAMVVKATGTVTVQNDEYLWYRSASTAITAADSWQATGMWGWIEQPSIWGSPQPIHTWFSAYAGYPPTAFSLTATVVPEPTTGVSLFFGFAVLLCSQARNRQPSINKIAPHEPPLPGASSGSRVQRTLDSLPAPGSGGVR